MIRNLMLGISLLSLTGASAIAAPAKVHASKPHVVAQANPAGEAAAPADKPAAKKEPKKHTKKTTKTDATKEMKGAPEKTPAPAPETK